MKLKKYLGHIFLITALYFAFYRGKRQGELECIDFNVLTLIDNFITIIGSIALLIISFLLQKNTDY